MICDDEVYNDDDDDDDDDDDTDNNQVEMDPTSTHARRSTHYIVLYNSNIRGAQNDTANILISIPLLIMYHI